MSDLKGLLCVKKGVGFSGTIGKALAYGVLEYPPFHISTDRKGKHWTQVSPRKPRLFSHLFPLRFFSFLKLVLGEVGIRC